MHACVCKRNQHSHICTYIHTLRSTSLSTPEIVVCGDCELWHQHLTARVRSHVHRISIIIIVSAFAIFIQKQNTQRWASILRRKVLARHGMAKAIVTKVEVSFDFGVELKIGLSLIACNDLCVFVYVCVFVLRSEAVSRAITHVFSFRPPCRYVYQIKGGCLVS